VEKLFVEAVGEVLLIPSGREVLEGKDGEDRAFRRYGAAGVVRSRPSP
jgi:hypothetical protein